MSGADEVHTDGTRTIVSAEYSLYTHPYSLCGIWGAVEPNVTQPNVVYCILPSKVAMVNVMAVSRQH